MSENKLQKSLPTAIKERGQYALALVVIASMLVVTNIPVFVIFFFGIFAYFVIRMFSTGPRNETREIFEFYLSANEILRTDDRRWYGFEIHEAITRGEEIVHRMSAAPPLVRFALGALYNKIGDHKSAVNHLGSVVENPSADELSYVYPTPELRNYVKVLRKIEREPAGAPLTSSAVRSLERVRKIRGQSLLEASRTAFATGQPFSADGHVLEAGSDEGNESQPHRHTEAPSYQEVPPQPATIEAAFSQSANLDHDGKKKKSKKGSKEEEYANRQPITDVLHDIYDRNIG
ncbi:MAG: hypothetical protein PSX80_17775 [bacterium]|nr:hypothetical protein [bacterium]